MNRHQIVALVSLPLGLAVACGDDSSSDTGQGGTASTSNGGSSNAGTAGSSSAAAGSGGSSSGSSAGGNSGGGASGTGGVAGSSGSGNPTRVEDVCQRGCVKTEPLNCPNDPADCEAGCLADYLDFPVECRELVLVLGECAVERPASDFLCNEDGDSTLRDGVCGTESIAVATCLLDAF